MEVKKQAFDPKPIIIYAVFIIFLFFAIVSQCLSLQAYFLYEKALSQVKPSIEHAKLNYYQEVISLLTQAIDFNRSNADYYAKKADYFIQASDDGLKKQLAINDAEIEKMYEKAIALNPLDYEYHLKLGWFYANKDEMQKAREQLQKAIELYPTNFQVYLYLGKYYLRAKEPNLAFNNFILAFYLGGFSWPDIMQSIKEDVAGLSFFLMDEGALEFKLIVHPRDVSFNFNKQGFIHKQIPLKIKVYVKKEAQEVSLYYDADIYRNFRWADGTQELDIYELTLESFAPGVYLDGFKIRTKPLTNIEKIEFIYKFYPPHPQ